MAKLTETEATILAELLYKVTGGDEKLANEVADVIYDMVGVRSLTSEVRQEKDTLVCGW